MTSSNLLLFLYFLVSCKLNNDDINYDLINNFIINNNVKIENLSDSPFYLNKILEDYGVKEINDMNFDLKEEIYKINPKKISFIRNKNSHCQTSISKQLYSNDKKTVMIAIQTSCGLHSINIKRVFYILKEYNKKWLIIRKSEIEIVS